VYSRWFVLVWTVSLIEKLRSREVYFNKNLMFVFKTIR